MDKLTLNSSVSKLAFVGPSYEKRLEKLDIFTIEDLLLHIPHRYLDFSKTIKIKDLKVGEIITVSGVVNSTRNQFTKSGKRMQIGSIEDETGKITVLWFNQPFLVRALYPGAEISLSGTASWFAGKPALISPEFEIKKKGYPTTHTGKISGIYSETKGLSSKWLRSRIKMAISKLSFDEITDLPKSVLDKYKLISFDKAITDIHFPKDVSSYELARNRLAFDELLKLQIDSITKKNAWRKNTPSHRYKISQKEYERFVKSLPFDLTNSQKNVIEEVFNDLSREYPMNRLLQGDVGSGKTVIAASAIYISYMLGYQSVIMAPTQILAQQHFNSLNSMFSQFKIKIKLITGHEKQTDDKADLFIGTHALIHRKLKLDNVGLIIIDEQHKFGVEQREHLLKRKVIPHILTMTATPIPRTIALTLYGDQELSILTESPSGRQKINTWLVPPEKVEGAYNWIRSQLTPPAGGSQVFWVCPLIEESESETLKDVKSVKTQFLKLKNIFKDFKLGLLHGRMKEIEKHKVLDDFKNQNIDILITTPVVEVGIDIPNATMMVIEAADRFGLAQLHQLRGRVGRGEKKSYCLLFSERTTPRLEAITKTHSGFELAELDLRLRGPGEVFGFKQHGFKELKIASWTDTKLIKQTREAATLMTNG